MRVLYHYPLSPFSRKVRLFMKEKHLEFDLKVEHYWEKRREFIAMNPAAQVPVLQESDGFVVADSTAICEYIEETSKDIPLIGHTPQERAEVRRIAAWFNNKFYYEVTKHLLDEKVIKFLRKEGEPRTDCIRAGKENILYHMDYITFLTKKHKWLAGDTISLADITAAAHFSVLDYLGDVPWDHSPEVKNWYAVIKSRPSFRTLLSDRVGSFPPSKHYTNLDF